MSFSIKDVGRFIISIVLLIMFSSAYADDIVIDNDKMQQTIMQIQFIEDASMGLSVDDIRQRKDWSRTADENFNKGFNGSIWWVKASIRNPYAQDEERLIEIGYPILDYLDVYIENSNGEILAHHKLGDKRPFYERLINHRHFVVPVHWDAQQTLNLYFRIQTEGSVQLPLALWKDKEFYANDETRVLILGIYYGIMLIMMLYNLFIFFTLRDKSYIYYVGFVAFFGLLMASLNGIGFQYLWPNATHWNDIAIVFAINACALFGVLFAQELLSIRWSSKTGIVSQIALVITVVGLFASFILPYNIMIRVSAGFIIFLLFVGLFIGVASWLQGNVLGMYYTLAWAALLTGSIILGLSKSGLLPQNLLTSYAAQFGSAIEVLMLSFALAERINIERRLRYVAQKELLNNEMKLRKVQENALAEQKRSNELLEERVAERTHKLEKANEILKELNSTDSLTGLNNRAYLDEMLIKEVSHCASWKKPLSVLLMDIDHFKKFNDRYGHLLGDECLKEVAKKITECAHKNTDHSARYGGEEFCVILPDTQIQGAMAVADRIRESVESIVLMFEGRQIRVTISIGVASYIPNKDDHPEEFIARADQALYQAKENGRNLVVEWKPS